jgi:hypothetical protein
MVNSKDAARERFMGESSLLGNSERRRRTRRGRC